MKKLFFIFFWIFIITVTMVAHTLTEVQVDTATREVNISFWDKARALMRSVRKKPKIGIDGEPVATEEKDDGTKDKENSPSRDFWIRDIFYFSFPVQHLLFHQPNHGGGGSGY